MVDTLERKGYTVAVGSRGPYPYHEGRHLIVALREWVYADESGIHGDSRWCWVAGYRASPTQWKRFNQDWDAILHKPEYQVRGAFHSKEFFNRGLPDTSDKNQYKRWSDQKAQRFLDELLATILRRKIRAVHGAVEVAAFNSLTYGERCQMVGYAPAKSRRQNRKPQPYHMAVRLMVEDALAESASDTELHFVIAEQKDLQQRALDGYALTKELWQTSNPHLAKRLKDMGIEAPLDFPGLQAADLLAYLLYGFWSVGVDRLSVEKSKALIHLSRQRQEFGTVGANGMEELLARLTPERRAEVRAMAEPL